MSNGSAPNRGNDRNFFKLAGDCERIESQSEFELLLKSGEHISDVEIRPEILTRNKNFRDIEGKTFQNVSFSKKEIKRLNFREVLFKDCLFIGTKFIDCEFHNCSFESCNLYKASFESTYIDPRSFNKTFGGKSKEYTNIGLWLYKDLSLNSIRQNQAEFRAIAELKFRQFQRLHLARDLALRKISKFSYRCKVTWSLFLEVTSGFGWRPTRLAICAIACLPILVAANYFLWPFLGMRSANGGVEVPRSLFGVIDFTLSVLTTLGRSAAWPASDIGTAVVACESIVGIILFSITASLFFRFLVKT